MKFCIFCIFIVGNFLVQGISVANAYGESIKLEVLPSDIKSFVGRRDKCNHFRDEPWDSGNEREIKARRVFIFKNIKYFCNGTDVHLKSLLNKYRNNKRVMDILKKYDV